MTERKEMTAEEVLKKYDAESNTMEYTGVTAKIISAIAISFSVFQIYTASFGLLDAQLQRAIHLGFGLCLSFLLYPTKKSWRRDKLHPLDLILAILGAAAPAYIVMNHFASGSAHSNGRFYRRTRNHSGNRSGAASRRHPDGLRRIIFYRLCVRGSLHAGAFGSQRLDD